MDDIIEREAELFNNDDFICETQRYRAKFGHANGVGYYNDYCSNIIRSYMSKAKDAITLELGTTAWYEWIDFENAIPSELTCINISENALKKGLELYLASSVKNKIDIKFRIMDANRLEFSDESIDLIYGSGILHHLDFEVAINEIQRVLKPGGCFLFTEPLISNPIAKLIRWLTPAVRTPDEKPLGKKDLKLMDNLFSTKYKFIQLIYVPFGIISSKIFCNSYNKIMKVAFEFDTFVEKYSPLWIKLLFRYVYIFGEKHT